MRTQKLYTHVHPCIHVSTCDWNQIHTINPRVMQALLCLAVSGQALNGSLLHSNLQVVSTSSAPSSTYSLSLVGGLSITYVSLFKCHPWVGIIAGLPACLAVSSVAVFPSMKLLQATTLFPSQGSFLVPFAFVDLEVHILHLHHSPTT